MMNKVVEEGTGKARDFLTASRPVARPAPPIPIATPGLWATPATTLGGVWFRQRRLYLAQSHDGAEHSRRRPGTESWPMPTRALSSSPIRARPPRRFATRQAPPPSGGGSTRSQQQDRQRGPAAPCHPDPARRRNPGASRAADGRRHACASPPARSRVAGPTRRQPARP